MTLLVFLIVISRNLLFGVFSSRKVIATLRKINHEFQASVAEKCTSLRKT